MGCDIHVFAEKKKQDGTWMRYPMLDDFYTGRNYALFSLLADVRQHAEPGEIDYIPPIAEPCGWPDDATMNESNYDEIFHSYIYYHVDELIGWWERNKETSYNVTATDFTCKQIKIDVLNDNTSNAMIIFLYNREGWIFDGIKDNMMMFSRVSFGDDKIDSVPATELFGVFFESLIDNFGSDAEDFRLLIAFDN